MNEYQRSILDKRIEDSKYRQYEICVELGKIDGYGNGRKSCPTDMEVKLGKDKNGAYTFSVCANVWNHQKTDIIRGGQCVDYVTEALKGTSYEETASFLCEMWEKYHLNDLTAGTPAQEAALTSAKKEGILPKDCDYTKCCDYLKSIGLFIDREYDTSRYFTYGHRWLTREIPERDLEAIKEFMVTKTVPEWYKLPEKEPEKEEEFER